MLSPTYKHSPSLSLSLFCCNSIPVSLNIHKTLISSFLTKHFIFMALAHSYSFSSIRFEPPLRSHNHKLSTTITTSCLFARRFSSHFLSLNHRRKKIKDRFISSFAASHEDSKHSDIEGEMEKSELEVGAEESEEAWKKLLESFKEQTMKMQDMSQEAYELYSEKAKVILKDSSEKLKIQAEKASRDLSVIAKEISEESKEYLSIAAENSPEEVKDIVETFASSSDDLKEPSKVRDFYVGIPYGTLLTTCGFLSFMVTGSLSGIRFGVILGGTLLALSVSSLRSWKRGESSDMALKGQTAIASIIFLRDIRLLSQRPSLPSSLTTFISGSVVVFYLYRIMVAANQNKGTHSERGHSN